MKTISALILALTLALPALARGPRHTSSAGPGTGSKASSTQLHSYTKKDGTFVESHRRSTPDKSFNNNWSTKPNANPYTGKTGTRVTSPKDSGR